MEVKDGKCYILRNGANVRARQWKDRPYKTPHDTTTIELVNIENGWHVSYAFVLSGKSPAGRQYDVMEEITGGHKEDSFAKFDQKFYFIISENDSGTQRYLGDPRFNKTDDDWVKNPAYSLRFDTFEQAKMLLESDGFNKRVGFGDTIAPPYAIRSAFRADAEGKFKGRISIVEITTNAKEMYTVNVLDSIKPLTLREKALAKLSKEEREALGISD